MLNSIYLLTGAAGFLGSNISRVLLEKGKKVITFLSVGLSIITVLYLAIAREPYAVTVAFLLLLIKGGLLYKRAMAGR